jgi:three-Cys-motif partner protein
LFAGPGRYEDGQISTPLRVLQNAIADPDIRERLVTIFNDKDEKYIRSLNNEINNFSGIEQLKYAPMVYNEEVGDRIVKMFEKMKLIPTLFFVDPWGYKGLSLRLVNSVLKDWGCDCIFFFNYNRINLGLHNPKVKAHMDALFGEDYADNLRVRLNGLSSEDRELTIIEELAESLQKMGGKYVLPFRFRDERGTRTSHHLIYVSKNFRGYEIMKEIMAKESSNEQQEVPSFEYNPASIQYPLLFELARPLDDLGDILLSKYAGQQLTMISTYEKHNVGTPYIKKNYKDALKQLELEGRIECDPPADQRRKNTFADKTLVIYPK